MTKKNRYRLPIMLSGLAVLIVILTLFVLFRSNSTTTSNISSPGTIAFMWSPNNLQNTTLHLIITNSEGNDLRFAGYFTGPPAFSPDGNFLALGCPPAYSVSADTVSEICLINVEKFLSIRHQIRIDTGFDRYSLIDTRIALPEQCLPYQYVQGEPLEGILSIDWSPRADSLVIVCGDLRTRQVCILPMDADANCWEENASDNVFRAVWSPADENVLAISGAGYPTSKIYLVDIDGSARRYVADGMNLEWSPDGTRIAFVETITDPITGRHSQGIASVDLDGTNHEWLYQPDPENPFSYIDLFSWDSGWPSRLAWSPDGKYIIFSGVHGNLYNYGIYRLEVTAGEVISLVDTNIFKGVVVEPDWGR